MIAPAVAATPVPPATQGQIDRVRGVRSLLRVTGVALALKDILEFTLPYYEHVCGKRWRPAVLLQQAGYNVDFAYLAGVLRYSHALGADNFPCGVRKWPPDPA